MYTYCCVEHASCLLLAGYLSSKPAELLLALLQFACTVVESRAAPSDVLTHYLPNLFGPGKVVTCRTLFVSMQRVVCLSNQTFSFCCNSKPSNAAFLN